MTDMIDVKEAVRLARAHFTAMHDRADFKLEEVKFQEKVSYEDGQWLVTIGFEEPLKPRQYNLVTLDTTGKVLDMVPRLDLGGCIDLVGAVSEHRAARGPGITFGDLPKSLHIATHPWVAPLPQPNIGFPVSNPYERISALADRLNVKPTSSDRRPSVCVCVDGKTYDVFEIVNALLDRLDQAGHSTGGTKPV